jgi:chromosome segregation ATPase
MFSFINSLGKNKQLEEIITRLHMNASNNYKDAAQLNLREFEEKLRELEAAGKLSEKQKSMYEQQLADFRRQMDKFTHKDQKCTWV